MFCFPPFFAPHVPSGTLVGIVTGAARFEYFLLFFTANQPLTSITYETRELPLWTQRISKPQTNCLKTKVILTRVSMDVTQEKCRA